MVANAVRWTVKDLETMPDDWGWKRYEVIDGELFVTIAPHISHQSAAGQIQVALSNWSDKADLGWAVQTPGITFSPEDGVIPDLVWATHQRIKTGLNEAGHFVVAPELIIEILSAEKAHDSRDRENKRKLYSRYGVQEYWIVDWRQKTLEIYRRDQAQLKLTCTLLGSDPITSPLLPGFEINLDQVFR